MELPLSEFLVRRDNSTEIFKTEEFISSSSVHSYFTRDKKEDDYQEEFEVINSILDFYSDLYANARKENEEVGYYRVYIKSKALPVSYEAVYSMLKNNQADKEPPLRLITKIAIKELDTITNTVNHLRHILQRKRELVSIGKVQQIDMHCLRWLTRQPGTSIAQKAGTKQKIMAIIREEKCNTLENQVLKTFLKYCVINCDSYIHSYKKKFPNSDRVKAVIKLKLLAISILETPEFQTITTLHSIPKPNYVLQNNANYRTIWNLYKQLVNHTKLIESVWSKRQTFFKEFISMIMLTVIDKKYSTLKRMNYCFWISEFPNKEGCILTGSNWYYLSYNKNLGETIVSRQTNSILSFSSSSLRFGSKIYYIPLNKTVFKNDEYLTKYDIVYLENPKTIYDNFGKALVINSKALKGEEFTQVVFNKIKELI